MAMSSNEGFLRLGTPHVSSGRGGRTVQAVVVHTTVGTFDSVAAWFASPASGVSAHYVVGLDGRVAQFVDEADTARHAGRIAEPTAAIAAKADDDGVNPITIGIEFEDGGDPFSVERPDTQYAAGAALIAAISARWDIPLNRQRIVGHRELFAHKECPGNLDVDRLVAEARALAAARSTPPGPLLTCLLPVRNGAEDLPGYFDSAAALGARIVALDDGSTDSTGALLRASALVDRVIANPPRNSHEGWDDGANRARLLAAAAEVRPRWVLFLDVDERIDRDDAAALKEFIARDAVEGVAYGLALHRDWGGSVASAPTIVYRLFAFEPGDELRGGRFHFNPVPVRIPRRAWLPTTIRARHLDSPERLERRRQKYAEADPGGADLGPTGDLLEPPAGALIAWPARTPGLDPLAQPAGSDPDPAAPLLTVLTPMRNAESDISGFLQSAERVADAIIALDDGGTDATATVLEADSRISALLRNPVRPDYAGWDDSANRQRLLDAAIAAGSRWVLYLDADERLDPSDAVALRDFVASEADPTSAYGMRVHRMTGEDLANYDRADLVVYRLFAVAPGQRLPGATLHLVPIPESIPRRRWHETTIRIQHIASATPERLAARIRKYEQADPERRWQSEYRETLSAPGTIRPFNPRPAELPVLAGATVAPELATDLDEYDPDAPVLSAIVIATDDEDTIERSVRAVVEQDVPEPFEVVVVVSGSASTAAVVRATFGGRVRLVEIADRVAPGAARNAGLRIARGEYVSFPGSHVELEPGSLAARLAAHERGWAMVTGSIVNGNLSAAGWASYFIDHSSALPGRPSTALDGAPAHCSYVREFLVATGGFPEDMRAGEDTVANERMWNAGHRAYRERLVRLRHHSPCSTRFRLFRHHFQRGRAFGRILRDGVPPNSGLPLRVRATVLVRHPRSRLDVTDARVEDWGSELEAEYARVRRLVKLGLAAAGMGAWVGTLGRRRSAT